MYINKLYKRQKIIIHNPEFRLQKNNFDHLRPPSNTFEQLYLQVFIGFNRFLRGF